MIRLLTLVLALLTGVDALAACAPASPAAVRTGYFSGSNSAFWAYWYCTDTGAVTVEIRVLPVAAITPALVDSIRSYASGSNPAFAATAPALPATDSTITPAFIAALAASNADPARPVTIAEVWTAAGTGTIYTTAAGKLTGVVGGRKVVIGTVLDCTMKVTSGALTYCSVAGGAGGVASEVTLAKKASP